MEDVLYILIGVAWVAYSIYSYKQKAKKQQVAKQSITQREYEIPDSEEQPQQKQSALRNIISEFQSYSQKESGSSPYYTPENESVFSEAEANSVENISSIEELTESNSPLSQEMLNQYLKKDYDKEITIENKDIDKDIDNNTEIEFEFDLKKAIIFSEILKRPEY